ncbi:hypothetical protein D9M69_99700 [compost metagenome]
MKNEQNHFPTARKSAFLPMKPSYFSTFFPVGVRRMMPTPGAECFESTAECAVLHGLLADLEKQLVAPFRADYADVVKEARLRLEASWDYADLRG